MKKIWVVTKNELLRYFISPLAYVYLVSFLLLNGTCAFYFGHFWERGQASLESVFAFLPWLYLLFIPGICMRLWSEEFRNHTVVQIMTQPVPTEALVWGKFWASWLFCGLALVLTFPFWLTVNVLGNPDNGVIAVGYLASLLLAGCMLAISQTMSSLTKNQVIALVLSVGANLLFFWSGLEFVLSFFRLFLPDYMIDAIASFSFLTHFSSLSRGLLELRDILFFVSIIVLFNLTTVLIVGFKTAGTSGRLKTSSGIVCVWAWVMILVGFMGFNLLANHLTRGIQIDFTQDKVYTLTPATEHILKNLPEPVTAKLYYSTILERRNPDLRTLFDSIRSLLEQYKTASNGRFDYRIYYPQSLDKIEDRAIGDGIQPIPLIDLNQNALFGMTLSDTLQNKKVIPLFISGDRMTLEQDITSKIYQLSAHKKTLGLLSSLPINGKGGTESFVLQPWEMYQRIAEFYNIIDINTPEDLEKHPDVLMMVHPRNLDDEMVEAVKKYSDNYGNVLLLLDSASEAPRLYSSSNVPYEPSDLHGLDEFWGFRFYNEYVVADLDNSILVDATSNYKNNPAYTQDVIQFKVGPAGFNPNHPMTKNLKSLLMTSVSIILPRSDDVYFIPLLQAGTTSALMPISVVYDGLNPRQILSYFKPDSNPKILAAGISGKTGEHPFNVVVVGDTDFLYDAFWTSSQMILDQNYSTTLFNNADFVLNALDYLSGNNALLGVRGKSHTDRLFAGIEKQRKQSLFEFKLKEEEIFNQINETKEGLEEIINKRSFENRDVFTPDELAVLAGVRKKLDKLRGELADIRLQTNKYLENLGRWVRFLNILALPFLALFGFLIFRLIKRGIRFSAIKIRFDSVLRHITFGALILFVLGLASVYFSAQTDIQKYEDQLIFPDLSEKINDVSKIVIQTRQATMTLVRREGIWSIEDDLDLPVYQDRVRNFLSVLLSARLYEKKSDKAENLYMFGLQPVSDPDSPNTRLELFSDQGEVIASLEVGTYNIDLGRGSKAAYVKFDNRFQVWLVEADFIDLKPDPIYWTYRTIWNLRFGRLVAYNDETSAYTVSLLVRDLLNIPFTDEADSLSDPQLILTLNLKTEFVNDISLNFYQSDDKVWLEYVFPEDISEEQLKNFSGYVKNRFLQIDSKKMEKIKNDIFYGEK